MKHALFFAAVMSLSPVSAYAEPAPIDLQLPQAAVGAPSLEEEITAVIVEISPDCERLTSRTMWGGVVAAVSAGLATTLTSGSIVTDGRPTLETTLQIAGAVSAAIALGAGYYQWSTLQQFTARCDIRRRIRVPPSALAP